MTAVLCASCGFKILGVLGREARRASNILTGAVVDGVRLAKAERGWPFDTIANRRREEKKLKDAADRRAIDHLL